MRLYKVDCNFAGLKNDFMKPLNLFAVLMCCCYVAVAQNIPSGSGNPPSERGALPVPVPVGMDVRHYRSMVDEGADERKLQELCKRNEELKLRIYLSRRLLRNVDR